MLLTNQQRFLLEWLQMLGGARIDQLAALLRPVFCTHKPEIARGLTDSALAQLRHCNVELRREGELCWLPAEKPDALLLEAIDVMLELSDSVPLSAQRGEPPILLRFCVQEPKLRQFAVTLPRAELGMVRFQPKERIILLTDGGQALQGLPAANKQFYAVRQEDGTHRFFALDGTT